MLSLFAFHSPWLTFSGNHVYLPEKEIERGGLCDENILSVCIVSRHGCDAVVFLLQGRSASRTAAGNDRY